MARIRSVHPGLFTDEAFVGLSMPARVLLIGLWTEADDQGVFDWKPITIKMRVMPADNVDVHALLQELSNAGVVREFQDGGRQLGAIRNFCKFQRPKTPKYRDIKSTEIIAYVSSTYGKPEIETERTSEIPQKLETAAPEVEPFPQNGEIPPQMEDGGGNRKKRSSLPKGQLEEKFEEFWREKPRRLGDDPKKPAKAKFFALVAAGEDPDAIIAGARAATAEARARGNYGTQYVPQSIKWLRDERWRDCQAKGADPPVLDWDTQISRFKRGMPWTVHIWGPEPGQLGCRVPPEILSKYGFAEQAA